MAANRAMADETSPSLDADRAEEIYREYLSMLRENPDDAAVNMKLARAAVAAKHPHQAVMAYERMLAMYPGDPVILRELADVYDSFGDPDMAALYRSQAGRGSMFQTSGGVGERFRRSAILRLGVFYDGNANQGLESEAAPQKTYLLRLSETASFSRPSIVTVERLAGCTSAPPSMIILLGTIYTSLRETTLCVVAMSIMLLNLNKVYKQYFYTRILTKILTQLIFKIYILEFI